MEVVVIEERVYKELISRLENLIEIVNNHINSDNNNINEWLNGEEVCSLLKISQRSLQSYRIKGIIPYSQLNNKIYYKRGDIEKITNISR